MFGNAVKRCIFRKKFYIVSGESVWIILDDRVNAGLVFGRRMNLRWNSIYSCSYRALSVKLYFKYLRSMCRPYDILRTWNFKQMNRGVRCLLKHWNSDWHAIVVDLNGDTSEYLRWSNIFKIVLWLMCRYTTLTRHFKAWYGAKILHRIFNVLQTWNENQKLKRNNRFLWNVKI